MAHRVTVTSGAGEVGDQRPGGDHGRAGGIPLVLVSTRQPSAALLRRAVAHLAPVLPLLTELGERFAAAGHDLALVGGPVRDALLGRASTDLDFTTWRHPDADRGGAQAWGDAHLGHRPGVRHHRRPPGRHRRRGDDLPRRRLRRPARKPVVAFGDTLEDDLVRRDFTVNAMALRLPELDLRRPARRAGRPRGRAAAHPVPPEESFGDDPLRMLRAARFAAQLGFVPAPEVFAAMTAMAATIGSCRRSGSATSWSSCCWRRTPGPGWLLVATGLADHVLPELPALQLEIDEHHRHKDVYEHSLTVLEQAIDLEGPATAPEWCPARTSCCGSPPCCTTSASPRPGASRPAAGCPSTTTRWSAPSSSPGGCKALRFDKETIKAVARLVELHLRFHGYGEGPWTDSAVRRYVTDAGPAPPAAAPPHPGRLHDPQRAQGPRLAATYDDLEARIEALLEEEELQGRAPRARRQRDREPCSASRPARCRPGLQVPARGAPRRGAGRPGRRRASGCCRGGPSSRSPRAEPAPTLPAAARGRGGRSRTSVRTGIRLGSTVRVRRPEGARPCPSSRSPDQRRPRHRRSPSRCPTGGTPCLPAPTCCGPVAPARRATRWRSSWATTRGRPATPPPTWSTRSTSTRPAWHRGGAAVRRRDRRSRVGRPPRLVGREQRTGGRGAPRVGRRPRPDDDLSRLVVATGRVRGAGLEADYDVLQLVLETLVVGGAR